MTIEEKAKAYDKAIRESSKIINHCAGGANIPECVSVKATIEQIFPELKESEDEKIRKAIYNCVNWFGFDSCYFKDVTQEECLAWLERQGEQKPIDPDTIIQQRLDALDDIVAEQKPDAKVEQKFKVGDYIISNNNSEIIYHITGTGIDGLENPDYVCEHVGIEKEYNSKIYDMRQDKVDANFRLWTIQDAKDGDVLVCGVDEKPFIFKGLLDPNYPNCPVAYCGIDPEEHFCVSSGNYWWTDDKDDIHPATKEQRDLLFQKMKESGYEWDAEKKELKKIEQKPAENKELTEFDKAVGVSIGTWNPKTQEQIQSVKAVSKKLLKLAKKQINDEQKPAWSEEDRIKCNGTIHFIENLIREGYFDSDDVQVASDLKFACKVLINWLKSLKDRYTWKPSDEQMTALEEATNKQWDVDGDALWHLYQDLKKLREV